MRVLRYRYPLLVGSVAEHVARVGRLPLVDALGVSGPAQAVRRVGNRRSHRGAVIDDVLPDKLGHLIGRA
jgi:hypothetical protein